MNPRSSEFREENETEIDFDAETTIKLKSFTTFNVLIMPGEKDVKED